MVCCLLKVGPERMFGYVLDRNEAFLEDKKMYLICNPWLTPLENFRFFGDIRYIFLLSRKASFLCRTSPNIISAPIFNKTN